MRRGVLAIGLLASGFVPLVLGALFVHERSSEPASGPKVAREGAYRGSSPPGRSELPDFQLRSYRGATVRSHDLRGKVVLVTFLDTRCTTQCPIIAGILGEAMRKLPAPARAKTVAFAISVDSEYDTPESVGRFLRRQHVLGTFDFLLGTEEQLRPVWRAFYVLAVSKTANPNIHSADVRVFDAGGVWVSILHVGVDLTPANVAHDVETALEEGKTS
jgi:protein SCO1/2